MLFQGFWFICCVKVMHYQLECHPKLKKKVYTYFSIFMEKELILSRNLDGFCLGFFLQLFTHTSQWVKGRISFKAVWVSGSQCAGVHCKHFKSMILALQVDWSKKLRLLLQWKGTSLNCKLGMKQFKMSLLCWH